MFDDIYDNGAVLLGKIRNVIHYLTIQNPEDDLNTQELIKDLREIQAECFDAIVAINYDNGMGYSIDYWRYNDKIMNF